VGIKTCKGVSHLKETLAKVENLGGEGLMLRKPKSQYEYGRSNVLLKVKTCRDDEGKVIGYEYRPGSKVMKHLITILPTGVQCDIGGGFTEAMRRKPPKIGEIVTFKYQELSSEGKPRFPIFLRIRTDVTWDDVCKNYVSFKPEIFEKKKAAVLEKQHSIMFTSVPSIDLSSGEKIITDDDAGSDKDDAESEKHSTKSTNIDLPLCKYGEKCYQTKQEHTSKYAHPWRKKKEETIIPSISTLSKITCTYGKDCHMTSEYHLSHYIHSTETTTEPEQQEYEKNTFTI